MNNHPTLQELFMSQLLSEYTDSLYAHDSLERLSNFQLLERLSDALELRLSAQTTGSQS